MVNWLPIIIQGTMIVAAIIGLYLVNDRRITVLEQNLIYLAKDMEGIKSNQSKLTDNQMDVSRTLGHISIVMDRITMLMDGGFLRGREGGT